MLFRSGGTADSDAASGGSDILPSGSVRVLTPLDSFLDAHFPDERMERIYPNAKIVEE